MYISTYILIEKFSPTLFWFSKFDVKLGAGIWFQNYFDSEHFLIFIEKVRCIKHTGGHRHFSSKFDGYLGRRGRIFHSNTQPATKFKQGKETLVENCVNSVELAMNCYVSGNMLIWNFFTIKTSQLKNHYKTVSPPKRTHAMFLAIIMGV